MKKITLLSILSLFVFCLGNAQQIKIPNLQNSFDVYQGTYLQSYCDFKTKKNSVYPYDFIEISLGYTLEGFTGEHPGWFKIYFSNDTIIDSGDTMVQQYRKSFSTISSLATAEVQVRCNNFPSVSSLYVILKLEFDSVNYPIANDRCYKKLSFYKLKKDLLYSTYVSFTNTQINQGSTLNTFLEVSNNTGETQQARFHNFYLCKTDSYDPNQSILLKEELLWLPVENYGNYGNLMGDTIHANSKKVIANYPLLIPNTVSSGDYYVFAIEKGRESDYQCMSYPASNKIHIGATVGINSTTMNDNAYAYPNPVSTTLTVNFGKPLATARVEIVNILGEKLNTYIVEGSDRMDIDVHALKNGVYFISILSDHQEAILKVLKTN